MSDDDMTPDECMICGEYTVHEDGDALIDYLRAQRDDDEIVRCDSREDFMRQVFGGDE